MRSRLRMFLLGIAIFCAGAPAVTNAQGRNDSPQNFSGDITDLVPQDYATVRRGVCSQVALPISWTSSPSETFVINAKHVTGLEVECDIGLQCRASAVANTTQASCPIGTELEEFPKNIPFSELPTGLATFPPYRTTLECRNGEISVTSLGFEYCTRGYETIQQACTRVMIKVSQDVKVRGFAKYLCADTFDASLYPDAPKFHIFNCIGKCAGGTPGGNSDSGSIATSPDNNAVLGAD